VASHCSLTAFGRSVTSDRVSTERVAQSTFANLSLRSVVLQDAEV
jgi:hypothetical protein